MTHKTAKLRMVRPGVLEHWCPACERVHSIDVHAVSRDGRVTGWCGSFTNPSIGEPVRHEKNGEICEYLLRAGVLYFLESSTHSMVGKTCHLVEFPA